MQTYLIFVFCAGLWLNLVFFFHKNSKLHTTVLSLYNRLCCDYGSFVMDKLPISTDELFSVLKQNIVRHPLNWTYML